jgi:hypothetical protein
VHMMRVRMAREQRHELHQLAYALRVATFAQKPLLSLPASKGDVAQREVDLFDGYSQRRAWLGWTHVVAQARIERDYRARCEVAARGLQYAAAATPAQPRPSMSGGLLGWFSKPQEPNEVSEDDLAAADLEHDVAVGRELKRLRMEKKLSNSWLTWRVQTSQARLRSLEDADKSALITTLWKAATSGLMDSQVAGPTQPRPGPRLMQERTFAHAGERGQGDERQGLLWAGRRRRGGGGGGLRRDAVMTRRVALPWPG